MQEQNQLKKKNKPLKYILILAVAAYLIFTTTVTLKYYTGDDRMQTNDAGGWQEVYGKLNFRDPWRPSGMVIVDVPVSYKNIRDRKSFSPGCLVDVLVKGK